MQGVRASTLAAIALAAGISLCNPLDAEGQLRHGVIWYDRAPNNSVLDVAASRYEVGVTGKGEASDPDKVYIKSLKPGFRWFVYNSGTDTAPLGSTAGTPEHDRLVELANERGWDPDEVYLHYYDDTRVDLGADTVLIRGWGGGSAASAAEARIPVYTLNRRVVNFSTRRAAQLHKEVMVQLAFDTPFDGSTLYPDGIFLDNSSAELYNYGTVLSGGHVRETPGIYLIGSPQFQEWQWEMNFGPFLTALKDTLETSASWGPDGQRKHLMINVANIWDDSYVSRDVADVLFLEFQYNPVRNFGLDFVDEVYRRDVLAASAGIASFYSATMTRTVSGHVGSYSFAETLLGNLAWYLMTRTPSTIFYEMGTPLPSVAGWDTLTWRGCIDVANQRLGAATGVPYTLAQGADPLGNAYVVKARRYEHGLVVMRNRGNYDEGIEPETAVTMPLPRNMFPVSPSGQVGPFVAELTLRNGQAALLLDDPTPVVLEMFAVERVAQGAELHWMVSEVIGEHLGFHVYRADAQGTRMRLTPELLSGGPEYRYLDADAPADGARYWLAEETSGGSLIWYGPVELEPLASARATVFLEQGHPNPFREATTLRFGVGKGERTLLRVLDVRGRVVRRLFETQGDGVSHAVTWRGDDEAGTRVSPGVYFCRLETPTRSFTRKLLFAP